LTERKLTIKDSTVLRGHSRYSAPSLGTGAGLPKLSRRSGWERELI